MTLQPDAVLIFIAIPGPNGLETTRRLVKEQRNEVGLEDELES
jgi:CheY-like chemotaxis protein